jgi:hypothetical protein
LFGNANKKKSTEFPFILVNWKLELKNRVTGSTCTWPYSLRIASDTSVKTKAGTLTSASN